MNDCNFDSGNKQQKQKYEKNFSKNDNDNDYDKKNYNENYEGEGQKINFIENSMVKNPFGNISKEKIFEDTLKKRNIVGILFN